MSFSEFICPQEEFKCRSRQECVPARYIPFQMFSLFVRSNLVDGFVMETEIVLMEVMNSNVQKMILKTLTLLLQHVQILTVDAIF